MCGCAWANEERFHDEFGRLIRSKEDDGRKERTKNINKSFKRCVQNLSVLFSVRNLVG